MNNSKFNVFKHSIFGLFQFFVVEEHIIEIRLFSAKIALFYSLFPAFHFSILYFIKRQIYNIVNNKRKMTI